MLRATGLKGESYSQADKEQHVLALHRRCLFTHLEGCCSVQERQGSFGATHSLTLSSPAAAFASKQLFLNASPPSPTSAGEIKGSRISDGSQVLCLHHFFVIRQEASSYPYLSPLSDTRPTLTQKPLNEPISPASHRFTGRWKTGVYFSLPLAWMVRLKTNASLSSELGLVARRGILTNGPLSPMCPTAFATRHKESSFPES